MRTWYQRRKYRDEAKLCHTAFLIDISFELTLYFEPAVLFTVAVFLPVCQLVVCGSIRVLFLFGGTGIKKKQRKMDRKGFRSSGFITVLHYS